MQRTISLAAAKSSSSTSVLSLRPLMAKRLGIVRPLASLSVPNFRGAWNYLGFRTLCSTNNVDFCTEEFEVGSSVIRIETGKIACFADGSVMMGMDETKVLSTVCTVQNFDEPDLLVTYHENLYAQGFIPNLNISKREASRKELLTIRLCQQAISPLIPSDYDKSSINGWEARSNYTAFPLEVSNIVETALLAVLPPQESYPSTVSIISEVKGRRLFASTCMAMVCGGSMAMMNSGILLRAHVAAISLIDQVNTI